MCEEFNYVRNNYVLIGLHASSSGYDFLSAVLVSKLVEYVYFEGFNI